MRNVFRMTLQNEAQRVEDFLYCLVEFRLGGVLRFYLCHYFSDVGAPVS